jgi:hypothetical protein
MYQMREPPMEERQCFRRPPGSHRPLCLRTRPSKKAPQPERLEPEAVVILKELPAITRTVTRKSAVYGLEGVGLAGAAVLAKWCRQATVGTKRTIYEEILPHLPIWIMPDWGMARSE